MEEVQALAILGDPYAVEDNWLLASNYSGKNFKLKNLRSPDQDLVDVTCFSLAGLIVAFVTANLPLLHHNYLLLTAGYLFLGNAGMICLSATRKQRRSKFLVITGLALSIAFLVAAFICILFPPGWRV